MRLCYIGLLRQHSPHTHLSTVWLSLLSITVVSTLALRWHQSLLCYHVCDHTQLCTAALSSSSFHTARLRLFNKLLVLHLTTGVLVTSLICSSAAAALFAVLVNTHMAIVIWMLHTCIICSLTHAPLLLFSSPLLYEAPQCIRICVLIQLLGQLFEEENSTLSVTNTCYWLAHIDA